MRTGKYFIFILPMAVFLAVFFFLPVLFGIALPFFSGDSSNLQDIRGGTFGLEHFADVVSSAAGMGLWDAVRNTLLYTLCVSAGSIVLGLFGALIVSRNFPSAGIVRGLLMLSWIVPSYVAGLIWGFMWQQDSGFVNTVLFDWLHWDVISGLFGATWNYSADGTLVKPSWLSGQNAFWAIVVPTVWRNWPFCMMMFLSGIRAIPGEIYEAAALDGASSRDRFLHLTLPLLRPVFAVVILETFVVNIYSFNLVAMMFGNGSGFPGKFGDLMMTFLYRTAFQTWNFGAGAALGTLTMFFMMVCVSVWYRSLSQELRHG